MSHATSEAAEASSSSTGHRLGASSPGVPAADVIVAALLPPLLMAIVSTVLVTTNHSMPSGNNGGGIQIALHILLLVGVSVLQFTSVLAVSSPELGADHDQRNDNDATNDATQYALSDYSNSPFRLTYSVLYLGLHGTIFLNIVGAILSSRSSTMSLSSNHASHYVSRSGTRYARWWNRLCNHTNLYVLSLAMLLGPVMTLSISLIHSSINQQPMQSSSNPWNTFGLSYLIALSAILLIRRILKSQQRRRHILAGIPLVGGAATAYPPTNGNFDTVQPPPRVDRWFEWSVDEVAEWVTSLPPSNARHYSSPSSLPPFASSHSNAYSSSSNHNDIAELLQLERVDGAALTTMSIESLRSFGIAYGEAAWLRRMVQTELVGRYGTGEVVLDLDGSSPGVAGNTNSQGRLNAERWLDESTAARGLDDSVALSDGPDQTSLTHEKASELFAKRFGGSMKLAQFQIAASESSRSNNLLGVVDEDEPMEDTKVEGPGTPSSQPLIQFNESLLASMPPNVREVAMRRPDLVQSVLLGSQAEPRPTVEVEMSARTTASASESEHSTGNMLSPVQRAMLSNPSYAERYFGAQAAADLSGIKMGNLESNMRGGAKEGEGGDSRSNNSAWPNIDDDNNNNDDDDDVEEDSDTVGLLRRRPYR